MASRLQKTREYWQQKANACESSIEPKPKAEVFQYEETQELIKPARGLAPLSAREIEERIFILATDMNLPHLWAEAIVKLQEKERPKNISQASWLEIQEACTQLYRDSFGLLKLIINHDWELKDIFGCDPKVPMIRGDMMGLLLLLHQGDEVVGVNKHRIKILKKSGSKLVFSRSLQPTGERGLLHEVSGD